MHGCAIKARDRARSPRGTEIDRRREKGRLPRRALPHSATPRHATADPSMTAYLQRSREEGTRFECRCERGIAHEVRSATLCPISLGISLSLSHSFSFFLSLSPPSRHSLPPLSLSLPSSASPRSKKQLKHLGNS